MNQRVIDMFLLSLKSCLNYHQVHQSLFGKYLLPPSLQRYTENNYAEQLIILKLYKNLRILDWVLDS